MIKTFHRIYYKIGPHRHTSFLGIESRQFPADNWVIQEIISEVKPDFIIETGTGRGETTLFYATVLEKVNINGKVITVDINMHDEEALKHKVWNERVEFILGSSASPEVVIKIAERVKGHKVLVTLDASHKKDNVLQELKLYAPLVSLNSYIVVQDTQYGGHPIYRSQTDTDNPWEAVEKFLKSHNNFVIDRSREKHLISQYPSGFLMKVE